MAALGIGVGIQPHRRIEIGVLVWRIIRILIVQDFVHFGFRYFELDFITLRLMQQSGVLLFQLLDFLYIVIGCYVFHLLGFELCFQIFNLIIEFENLVLQICIQVD